MELNFLMKSLMNPERWNRVWRTAKQAIWGLVGSSAVAVVVTTTDIAKVEFGNEIWWPVATAGLTALAAAVRNFFDSKKD